MVLATAVLCSCGLESPAGGPAVTGGSDSRTDTLVDLMNACATGDEGSVRRIVEGSGADLVNAQLPATLDSPLLRATENGHVAIVQYLLSKGASPNLEGIGRNTPLMQASYLGQDEIVDALIKAGANPNTSEERYGYTPLIFAAWKGHERVVEQLVAAGADLDSRAKDGRTALTRAVQGRHSRVEEVLRRYGARE